MSEPTTTATGGALLIVKGIALMLPVFASAVAFWLGLRFVPMRQGHEWADVINRLVACFISSVVLGTITLVALYHHWPPLFTSAQALAVQAGFSAVAGFFMVTGCVLLVCSIPGPWLLAAVFLWLERRKDKDIEEILKSIREQRNQTFPLATWHHHSTPAQPDVTSEGYERCEGCAIGHTDAAQKDSTQ